LVCLLASADKGGGTAGFLGGTLLVVYPVSDAVATAFDLRRVAAAWPQWVNLAWDAAAAVSVLIAVRHSLAAAWTGSASAGLGALAQYSAGGAVWYLLTAFWLTRTARRPLPPGPVTRAGDSAR
jgi:hypothetical protein